jgi:hypothetical protein
MTSTWRKQSPIPAGETQPCRHRPNRIPYLTDKRVDILMSVGYSRREQVIDFAAACAPYYIAVIGPAELQSKQNSPASHRRQPAARWRIPR